MILIVALVMAGCVRKQEEPLEEDQGFIVYQEKELLNRNDYKQASIDELLVHAVEIPYPDDRGFYALRVGKDKKIYGSMFTKEHVQYMNIAAYDPKDGTYKTLFEPDHPETGVGIFDIGDEYIVFSTYDETGGEDFYYLNLSDYSIGQIGEHRMDRSMVYDVTLYNDIAVISEQQSDGDDILYTYDLKSGQTQIIDDDNPAMSVVLGDYVYYLCVNNTTKVTKIKRADLKTNERTDIYELQGSAHFIYDLTGYGDKLALHVMENTMGKLWLMDLTNKTLRYIISDEHMAGLQIARNYLLWDGKYLTSETDHVFNASRLFDDTTETYYQVSNGSVSSLSEWGMTYSEYLKKETDIPRLEVDMKENTSMYVVYFE